MPGPRRICTFPGCGGDHYGQGLCRAHLWQQTHGVELRPVRRLTRGRLCDFPGCGRKHKTRGLCGSHDSQRARGVPLTPIQPGTPEERTMKPAAVVPSRMPPGWGRPAKPPRMPKPAGDKTFLGLPVVAPTDPVTLAAMLAGLRQVGAEDLADVLGVTPDHIRAEAERWHLWRGAAA